MAELTAHDIDRGARVRAVTDNLYFWQGLRFVIVGPTLIAVAFLNRLAGDNPWPIVAALATLLVIFGPLSVRIERRYREEFGHVQGRVGAHRRRSRAKWMLVYPLMFGSLLLDAMVPLPFYLSGFTLALGAVLYQRSTGGGREHWLMLAALLVALGLAPLTGAVTTEGAGTLMMLLAGFGMLAASWLDDREMRRILEAAPGR